MSVQKYGCQRKVKSCRMVDILASLFSLRLRWCLSVMWFIHFLSFLRHCSEANYPPVGQSASNQIPRWEQWWCLTVCLMKHLSSVSAGPTPSKVDILHKRHLHEFFCWMFSMLVLFPLNNTLPFQSVGLCKLVGNMLKLKISLSISAA